MNWNRIVEVSEWVSNRVAEILLGTAIGVTLVLVYVAGENGLMRF